MRNSPYARFYVRSKKKFTTVTMRVISTALPFCALVAGTPVQEPFARDFGINYADCPEYFINGAEWPLV